MNRFLFLGLASAVLLHSANTFAKKQDSTFYLKGGVSFNKIANTKIFSSEISTYDEATGNNPSYIDIFDEYSTKYDNETYYHIAIGLGYEVNKFYNVELMLSYTPEITLSEDLLIEAADSNTASTSDTEYTNATSTLKVEYTALMFNNIVNIADYLQSEWSIKPYLGFGLGLVLYDIDEYSYSYAYTASNETVTGSFSSHSDINFAYSAIFGTTYPISEDLLLDFSYSYVDYGTFKAGSNYSKNYNTISTTITTPTTDWKAHELLLALRYSL